jgi:hypothetical protein
MTQKSEQTEVHTADNLSPAPEDTAKKPVVGIDKAKKGGDQTSFTVSLGGRVYSVKAKNAQEAADKAKKLHNSKKEK